MDDLVSTAWLAENSGSADLAIVDSSWFMPATRARAAARNISPRISPARASSTSTRSPTRANPAPHMLPSAADFGAAMEKLGVGQRRPHRRLRQQPDPDRRARLVHVPPFRRADRSRSSTAASRSGSRKAARPKAANPPAAGALRSGRASRRGRDASGRSIPASACRWSMPAAVPASKARRQTRARASPRATSPARATCLFPTSTMRTERSSRPTKSGSCSSRPASNPEKPFVASCGSGVTANSLIFAARTAREPRHAAVRRKLERMGRRSGDAQGARTRLAAEQLGEAGETLADCLGDHVDGGRMRLEALARETPTTASRPAARFADHALRTGVEAGVARRRWRTRSLRTPPHRRTGRRRSARAGAARAAARQCARQARRPRQALRQQLRSKGSGSCRAASARMVKKVVNARLKPPGSRRCRAGSSRAAGSSR